MDTSEGKIWSINVGDYNYRVTRGYSMSNGYYATIIHRENIRFGMNKDLYKHRSVTMMSKTAGPVNYKDAIEAFK